MWVLWVSQSTSSDISLFFLLECTSKKGKAGTPNSPPLMELDEGFEEDIDEEDIDEEEGTEESGEMEEAPSEPLEINKSQETEIRYYDQGYFF